jgi:hypothetical protein
MSWAIRMCGQEYLLSVYNEMTVEPHWRPEWTDTRFLAADALGRLYGAFLALRGEVSPPSWRERIEDAKVRAHEDHLDLLMSFPAVLQGERRIPSPTLEQFDEAIGDAYRRLQSEPSIDNLLCLTPVIHAYGVPSGINGAVREVVDKIRDRQTDTDEDTMKPTLILACHVAAMTNDVTLADAITDTAVEAILREQDPGLVQQMLFRLIECAAANPDREAALTILARRLEFLAQRLPVSEAVVKLFNLLHVLRTVEPTIAPLIARAVAVAKLAAVRAAAA